MNKCTQKMSQSLRVKCSTSEKRANLKKGFVHVHHRPRGERSNNFFADVFFRVFSFDFLSFILRLNTWRTRFLTLK